MSLRRNKKRNKNSLQKKIVGIQQQDTILKEFFRDNKRFADLFNGVFFQGREEIQPDKLEEIDTDISHILPFKQLDMVLKHTRDIAKKFVDGVVLVLLGTEFQSHIDYTMPVRAMGYDYSAYAKYIKQYKKFHQKHKTKLTSHEFLSGMQKTDRLPPVITLVLYTGRDPWDAPLSLHEMLSPIPEPMKSFVADYKINLLQVQNSEQFTFHNKDVYTLFDITRMAFQKQYDKIYETYQNQPISKEVVTAIGSIAHFPQLTELEEDQKGEITMCNFMEEYREYCYSQGKEDGLALGKKQGIALGEKRGIALGEKRGIALGEERGIALGKEQGQLLGMLNAAKLLVEQGKSITEISAWLHLPQEHIENYLAQEH